MDILSHALWTNLLFADAPLPVRATAIALSVLPDAIAFAPTTVRHFFARRKGVVKPAKAGGPPASLHFDRWAYRSYDVTHSLPVWTLVFGVCYWVMQAVPWALLAWLVHILVDIPTHTRSFFGTPFLWPFSNYKFDGISWGERWFMRLNYGSLLVMYIYWVMTSLFDMYR
jgi:hypothetical protein